MMKIKNMNQHSLRNEEYFQFMGSAITLIDSANQETQAAAGGMIAPFRELYARLDTALERIRKSTLTDPIAESDAARDNLYRAICLTVGAFSHSHRPSDVEAAAAVQTVIDHYGNFIYKSYNEETAIIHNLVQDLRERCAPQLTSMQLDRWVNGLEQANIDFEKLMAERFADQAANTNSDQVKALRNDMDTLYKQLTSTINARIVINGDTEYLDFVNKLNEQISYYRNTLAERRGRSKAKKERENTAADAALPNG